MNIVDKIILQVLKETAFDDWLRVMKKSQSNWNKLTIIEQFKYELMGYIGMAYTEYLNELTFNENERFDKNFVKDFNAIFKKEVTDLLNKYGGTGGPKYQIFDKNNKAKIEKIIIDEIDKVNGKIKPNTKPGTLDSPYSPTMKLKYADDILDILTKKELFLVQPEGDKYVIEVHKNGRYFFVTYYENKNQLTWRKESAIPFNSIKDAEEYIHKNKLENSSLFYASGIGPKIYEIKKYSDVRSH